MSISEKIKEINDKIKQNQVQYNLDRQTAGFLHETGKFVLSEKDLLEKAAATKRFEYSPLGKELKAQTSAAKKQYQKLDKVFEYNKKEKKLKSRVKSNLIYSKEFTFYKYHTTKQFAKLSWSKGNYLIEFKDILELFYDDTEKIKRNNEDQKKDLEKNVAINTASKFYGKFLYTYATKYDNLSEDQNKTNVLSSPEN